MVAGSDGHKRSRWCEAAGYCWSVINRCKYRLTIVENAMLHKCSFCCWESSRFTMLLCMFSSFLCIVMSPPNQSPEALCLSVHSSVNKRLNTIFLQWMNWFWFKLAQVAGLRDKGMNQSTLGVRRSKIKVTRDGR